MNRSTMSARHGRWPRVWRRALGACALTGALALGAVGCEAPDWTSTEYLSKQIESGDRLRALDEAARLDKEKQKELVPALVNAYNNDLDREKVFAILAEIRDDRAKSVYIDALKNAKSNRDRAKAAIALGDIKATDHVPDMVDMFRNVPNNDLRRSILEAFAAMPDAQQIPLLIEILTKYDPDREPIAYHAYACEVLAEIDQATEAVAEAVVYGMYLDNAKGQNVAKECLVAVASVGDQAVTPLTRVMKGEHEDIKKRFAKYDSYIEGSAEVTAVDALGTVRAGAAVDAIMERMTLKKDPPATYRDQKLLGWGQKRSEFFVASCATLGDIGDPKALEVLSKYTMPDKTALEPYQMLIDYDKATKLFMVEAAVGAINALGDRKGLDTLAECAQKGDIKELAVMKEEYAFQSRWQAARAYAMLGTGEHLEAYDKMAGAEKAEGMKAKWAEFRPALEVAKECGADAACYGKHLAGKDAIKAEKAAWELGRMEKGGAAEAALIGALNNPAPELRTVIIRGLFRVGTKASIEKINALLVEEKNQTTPEFKILHAKMRALREYIENKG